jgi:hypothetical protein
MIRFFCPDVYYWGDVIVASRFVLLILTCGLPFLPVIAEAIAFDARLSNPVRVHVVFYILLTTAWLCCLLGLIFIPSAAAVYLTCLGG